MRIVTWNINSIRIRLDVIKQLINEYHPDVICFQEIKTENQFFPYEEFFNLGFSYILVRGERSYNGVAIVSKLPIEISHELAFINNQARHISAFLNGTIEIHNFYFPAGGDIADPLLNPKFEHKISYIHEVEKWFKHNKSAKDKVILLGDLNIAP